MKKTLLVFTLIIFALTTMAVAGPPSEVWNETYESGGNDLPYGIATDAAGNVYVTGYYGDLGVAAACRTIKYDTDGNVLWNKLYDEDVVDAGYGVAVDGTGNVYVAGIAAIGGNTDYLLIKYNPDGDVLWVETWGAPGMDMARGVAADAAGNVYVTGTSDSGPNNDFRTIKYDSGGNLQWGQPHDEFGDDDLAYGVAVDDAGNVYVTGLTLNGADADMLTLKYDPDGNLEWSDVRDENFDDVAFGIALDADANVYVGGGSEDDGGADVDFFTVKYDTDGNFQWKERFGDDENNVAQGIAVYQSYVYLTGYTFNGVDGDFLTIRYDLEGNLGWEKDFDSGDNDVAYGVAVDGSQYVYVTGLYDDGADLDFRTIKYEQDDVAVAETPAHSPIILEVMDNFTSAPTICYSLPAGMTGTLTFYSADGRKLESYTLDSAQSAFTWITDNPSGVYFAKVSCGNLSATVRTIVTR